MNKNILYFYNNTEKENETILILNRLGYNNITTQNLSKLDFDKKFHNECNILFVDYHESVRIEEYEYLKQNNKNLIIFIDADQDKKFRSYDDINSYEYIIRPLTPRKLEKAIDFITKNSFGSDISETFLDAVHDWVWEIDVHGNHTYTNSAVKDILGYSKNEILGMHSTELWMEKHRKKKFYDIFEKTLASGKGWTKTRGYFQHKNGSEVICESSAVPIFNINRKLLGYRGIDRDITAQVHKERSLINSEQRSSKRLANIKFLEEAAVTFVSKDENFDIMRYIAKSLQSLNEGSYLILSSVDTVENKFIVKDVVGIEKFYEKLYSILGFNLVGKEFKVQEDFYTLSDGNIKKFKKGLYDLSAQAIPEFICKAIEKMFNVGDIYNIAFTFNDKFVASAGIILQKGRTLKNIETIKTFVRLASVALIEKQTKKELNINRKKLEEINTRYELANEAGESGIWDFNLKDGSVYYNKKYFTMLGYEPDELPHTKEIWRELLHPQDKITVIPYVDKMISEGKAFQVDFRLKCKNGKWKWIEGKGKTYNKDSSGNPTRAIGVHIDIDERIKAMEEIDIAKKTYRGVMDSLDEALYIQDKNGRFIDVNKAAERYYGYNLNDFIGKTPEFLSAPGKNDNNHVAKLLQKAYNGESQRFKYWGLRKNGTIFPKDVISSPGNFFGQKVIITSARDITEREKAASKIKENQERLESIHQALPDMLFVCDRFANVLYYNIPETEATKFSFGDLHGKNIQDFLPPEIANQSIEYIRNTIDNQEINTFTFSALVQNEEVIYESRIVPKGKNESLAIIKNITHQKQLENENIELEKQRLHLHRLETVGTLASGVAHDFNNILTPIIGYAELIKLQDDISDIVLESSEEIIKASNYAKDLVEQLLSFSRESNQIKKPIFIIPIIKEALKLIRSTLPASIKIETDLNGEMLKILGEPTKIHQIIMNLCTNAFHAIDSKGGKICITTEKVMIAEHEDKRYINLEKGDYIKLIVEDSGTGIPQEVQERIFEPFFTTKQEGEGSGLGLSVVHGIVKSYDGSIFVESEEGEGTKFEIYFPIYSGDMKNSEDDELEQISSKSASILLVDDREYNIKVLKNILEKYKHKVTAVTKSTIAKFIIERNPDKFDLVITDLNMPEISGTELALEAHKHNANLKIILMTGQISAIDEDELVAANIFRVLAKPILARDLLVSISDILTHQHSSEESNE